MKPLSSAVFFRARSKKVRWDGVIGYATPRSRIVYAPQPMPPAVPLGRRNAVRVLMGFRRKAVSLGIRYLKDRVVDFDVAGKQVAGVRLESGERLPTESIVNAANCWGPDLCDKLGMKVPVGPMRRLTFYFEIREKLEPMPLTRLCQLSPARRRLYQREHPL